MKAHQVTAPVSLAPELKCAVCSKPVRFIYGYVGRMQAVCGWKCSEAWDKMTAEAKSELQSHFKM